VADLDRAIRLDPSYVPELGEGVCFFGTVREGEHRYCSEECRGQNAFKARCDQIPAGTVREHLREAQQGSCPDCRGRGPLDIHVVYWVWSAIIFTRWGKTPRFSCRPCATKRQLVSLGSCFILGWWGVPWGLFLTPLQLYRNLRALLLRRDSPDASPELERVVRIRLAREQAAAEHLRGGTA
jgi:hypothetical protein